MDLPAVPGAAPAGETLFQKQSAFRPENRRTTLRLEKISAGLMQIKKCVWLSETEAAFLFLQIWLREFSKKLRTILPLLGGEGRGEDRRLI